VSELLAFGVGFSAASAAWWLNRNDWRYEMSLADAQRDGYAADAVTFMEQRNAANARADRLDAAALVARNESATQSAAALARVTELARRCDEVARRCDEVAAERDELRLSLDHACASVLSRDAELAEAQSATARAALGYAKGLDAAVRTKDAAVKAAVASDLLAAQVVRSRAAAFDFMAAVKRLVELTRKECS
jgi:hypothetical protein